MERRFGHELIGAKRGREQPDFRGRVGFGAAGKLDAALSLEKNEQVEMFRRSHGGDSLAKFPAFRGEVAAGGEKSFRDRAVRNADRIAAAAALFAEAHHVERLADMQRARLAVRPHAVVIEDAVRDVRVLLDFAQHHAGTDRVRGSCRNENGVACAHGHARKAIFHGAVGDGAAKRLARHVRPQAHAQFGALARRHHVPHLRLPNAARGRLMLFRVLIVRDGPARKVFPAGR